MRTSPPRLLFVALSDDAGADRIVAEIARRGAACALMAPRGALSGLTSQVERRHALPRRGGAWRAAAHAARGLEALTAAWRPDAAVPLDDAAAAALREIARAPRTGAAVRTLLTDSLGDPAHYAAAVGRGPLIALAARLGIRVPAQAAPVSLEAARDAAESVGYPLMVKREGTCGGGGVTPVAGPGFLAPAWRAAARRARGKRALRRLFGFGGGPGGAVTLQARVEGRLAVQTVACAAGRVLDGFGLAAEQLDPPVTGSSTVVRPLDHPEMAEAARRLVAALGCSGFASFDFILAPDGAAHLIEMNARPVGSGHLGTRFGHDLYGAWLRGFDGFVDAAPPAPEPAPVAVALFPKEMMRDPRSPQLDAPGVLHDVPWGASGLLENGRGRILARHPGAGPDAAGRLGGGRTTGGSALRPISAAAAASPAQM